MRNDGVLSIVLRGSVMWECKESVCVLIVCIKSVYQENVLREREKSVGDAIGESSVGDAIGEQSVIVRRCVTSISKGIICGCHGCTPTPTPL